MKRLALVFALLFVCGVNRAQAAVIQVGAFVGSDHVDWSQLSLGLQGTPTTTVTSVNGNSVDVTGNGDDLYAFREGTNFTGDYAVGEYGVGVAAFSGGETLTLDFTTLVSAVGAQIQPDVYGNYTAELRLFDSGLNLIGGPFQVSSSLSGSQDDSNPFLGAQSDSANIARAVFAIVLHDTAPDNAGVFINQLELDAAVPEPVSLSLLGFGLACYSVRRRRGVR